MPLYKPSPSVLGTALGRGSGKSRFWYILPFLLLLVAQVYSFGLADDAGGGNAGTKTLALGVSYLLAAYGVFRKIGVVMPILSRLFPLVLFAFYVFLLAGLSADPVSVCFRTAHMIGLVLVSLLTGLWIRGRTQLFIEILVVMFFFMTALSLYAVHYVPSLGLSRPEAGDISRWVGITGNPNFLGMLAAAAAWGAFASFTLKLRIIFRLLAVATVPISVILLSGSESRTALATVVAFGGLFFLFQGRGFPPVRLLAKRAGLFGVMALFGLFVAFAFAPERTAEVLMPKARSEATDVLSGRPQIWALGVQAFSERPWGWGYDDLTTFWKEHRVGDAGFVHFHNGFLDVAVKGGVLAEILLLVILWRMFRSAYKVRRVDPVFAKCFFVFLLGNLIYNLAEGGFFRETLFWTLMVVMWGSAEAQVIGARQGKKTLAHLFHRGAEK